MWATDNQVWLGSEDELGLFINGKKIKTYDLYSHELCTTRISIPFMKTDRNVYGLELTKTEYCSINQINKKLFTYPLVYSTI